MVCFGKKQLTRTPQVHQIIKYYRRSKNKQNMFRNRTNIYHVFGSIYSGHCGVGVEHHHGNPRVHHVGRHGLRREAPQPALPQLAAHGLHDTQGMLSKVVQGTEDLREAFCAFWDLEGFVRYRIMLVLSSI